MKRIDLPQRVNKIINISKKSLTLYISQSIISSSLYGCNLVFLNPFK